MTSNKLVDDAVERAALVLMPNTVRSLGLREAMMSLTGVNGQPYPFFIVQIRVEYRKLVSQ